MSTNTAAAPTQQVWVNTPVFEGNEKKYLMDCIDTGWVSSGGKYIKQFEEKMAQICNRKFATACTNGTAAIDIAIAALDIQPGDEFIVPSLTIISCVTELARRGAIIVPVDCDESFNMDPTLVGAAITNKTKGIMAVHIYHFPVDLDPILKLAEEHNLFVIEDTAEMIGQTYKGRPCGSFGHISCMSFYPNKHVTCGEGGMVLTNDPELHAKISKLRNLCFEPGKRRFLHFEIGWNCRMTNMQAAVGLAQAEMLEKTLSKKRHIGHYYTELLEGTVGLILPPKTRDGEENVYWVYAVVLDDEVASKYDAEHVMGVLKKRGVDCRPFFLGMHEQPVLKTMKVLDTTKQCLRAERYARNGFYIPSGLALTDDQIRYVAEQVREVMATLQ